MTAIAMLTGTYYSIRSFGIGFGSQVGLKGVIGFCIRNFSVVSSHSQNLCTIDSNRFAPITWNLDIVVFIIMIFQ